MTESTLQNALRDKVAEFAASDEALKEVVARLSELESVINSHRESRKTLDDASKALAQVTTSLSPAFAHSADAVRDIARVSSEFGLTLNAAVEDMSNKLAEHIEKSREQIERVSRLLSEHQDNLIKSSKANTTKLLIFQSFATLCILAAQLLR